MQTPEYCRRRLRGSGNSVTLAQGVARTTSAPLSRIPSMTVDHHGCGAGLGRRFENDCPGRTRREYLDHHFPLGRGPATTRPCSRPPGASADPVLPPALPHRQRRPAFGRGPGAVPSVGKRGALSGAGAQCQRRRKNVPARRRKNAPRASTAACPGSPREGPARGAMRPPRGWRRPARGRGLWAHGVKRGVIRTVAGVVTGSA